MNYPLNLPGVIPFHPILPRFHITLHLSGFPGRLKQVSESLSKASISPWLRERHVERTARPGLDAETAVVHHDASSSGLIFNDVIDDELPMMNQ